MKTPIAGPHPTAADSVGLGQERIPGSTLRTMFFYPTALISMGNLVQHSNTRMLSF